MRNEEETKFYKMRNLTQKKENKQRNHAISELIITVDCEF